MKRPRDISRADFSRPDWSRLLSVVRAPSPSPRRRQRLTLLSESGQSVTLPPVLNDLLTFLVDTWDQGEATRVMAVNDVLTTAQVADLLNVSRPYVVKLIDEGIIASHRVGTHRRVRVADALAYREEQDRVAEMALAEFHRIGAELNLPD